MCGRVQGNETNASLRPENENSEEGLSQNYIILFYTNVRRAFSLPPSTQSATSFFASSCCARKRVSCLHQEQRKVEVSCASHSLAPHELENSVAAASWHGC